MPRPIVDVDFAEINEVESALSGTDVALVTAPVIPARAGTNTAVSDTEVNPEVTVTGTLTCTVASMVCGGTTRVPTMVVPLRMVTVPP
jgi:hypothetical protein